MPARRATQPCDVLIETVERLMSMGVIPRHVSVTRDGIELEIASVEKDKQGTVRDPRPEASRPGTPDWYRVQLTRGRPKNPSSDDGEDKR
jgi:hypothetical protein